MWHIYLPKQCIKSSQIPLYIEKQEIDFWFMFLDSNFDGALTKSIKGKKTKGGLILNLGDKISDFVGRLSLLRSFNFFFF